MVAEAGPSKFVVLRLLKWLAASVVTLWQLVQEARLAWKLCSPEFWLLKSLVPRVWQDWQSVLTFSEPVTQFGVVWPPWQLTLEQVWLALATAVEFLLL